MKSYAFVNCLVWLAVVVFNCWIGTMAVNYLIFTFFEKTIPWFWALVLGLFTAELSVPGAIVVWILKSLNVF